MRYNNLDKFTKLSIAVIVIGIIIRFYLSSIYHVAGDGCWQLSNARFIANNLKLPLFENFGRDEPFWAPPLFHILIASVYVIFKNISVAVAEFAVKMVSPFFGSMALVFAFLIAKKLYNSKIAFYSAVFLAFIPLSLDYSVFSYVDGTLAFFAVLSVYFALHGRIISSSVAAGLAILTKYNGIFILPVLLYIIYRNNKTDKGELLKKSALILLIPAIIGSLWFIRNWIYLGNPVWPFMNNIFHGYQAKSFVVSGVGSVDLSKIISINAITAVYLGIFGVPNSSINSFYFFNIPYINFLLAVWLAGTFIFIIPLFAGLSRKLRHKGILAAWIISYFILCLLYVVNAGWSIIRFMLPAFPAVAMVWASGMERISSWKMGKYFFALICIVSAGLIATSFIKINLAAREWDAYSSDFEWVKENTDRNGIFLTGSQCISYSINRQTANPDIANLQKSDYAFVNQDFRLDKRAVFDNGTAAKIRKAGILVYRNDKTKTEIYKI